MSFVSGNVRLHGKAVRRAGCDRGAKRRSHMRHPRRRNSTILTAAASAPPRRFCCDMERKPGRRLSCFGLPNVFGKWCRPNYNSAVATFCHQICRGLPVTIDDASAPLRLVYIDDVVDAFVGLLRAPGETSGYIGDAAGVRDHSRRGGRHTAEFCKQPKNLDYRARWHWPHARALRHLRQLLATGSICLRRAAPC